MFNKRTGKSRSIRMYLLVLLLVVLIPLLLLQSIIYYYWWQTQKEQELTSNLELARAVSVSFQRFVRDILGQELAMGTALSILEPYSFPQANRYLTAAKVDYPEITFFAWVTPEGRVLSSSFPGIIGMDISHREYFQQILAGQDWFVSNLLTVLVTEEKGIVIARGIRDDRNILAGVMIAIIDPETLEFTLHIKRHNSDSIMIFDRDGAPVYIDPPETVVLRKIDWRQEDPMLQAALDGEEQMGTFVSPLDDERKFGAKAPIREIGYVTGASSSRRRALGPIYRSLLFASGLTAAVSLFSILLALLIASGITSRTTLLRDHAIALGRGHPDHRSVIPGIMEFEEVSLAFDQMAIQLEERKQAAESATREAEQRAQEAQEGKTILEALMAYVPIGVAVIDWPDMTIRFSSKAGEKMIGQTPQILKNVPMKQRMTTFRVFFLDGRQAAMEDLPIYRAVTDNKTILNEEWIYECAEGRRMIGLVNAGPIRDPDGRIIGGVVTLNDITDRKQIEQALQQARDELEIRVRERTAELERSNAELAQFAYVASHDLQEPLRMVASYVQLIEMRYKDKLDPEADEFINYAVEGAVRMQMLIRNLLEYSRLSVRTQPFEPTDFEDVLGQVLRNLQGVIEETGTQITHDPLPTISADKVQIIRVFQNLIDNAIKFRSDKPLRIHISAQNRQTEWLFSVQDNGIGIEPVYFDRIFVLFQRLHARRAQYPGTGIGLPIVKRIVEHHGGRVWIESEPGEGSTFYFTIAIR